MDLPYSRLLYDRLTESHEVVYLMLRTDIRIFNDDRCRTLQEGAMIDS